MRVLRSADARRKNAWQAIPSFRGRDGDLKMKKLLLASVSVVALTCATHAADMPAKAPLYAPFPIVDWTGAYIGAQGGAVRRDASSNFIFFEEPGANEGSKTGGTIGGLLGYTWQNDRFVYGLEGDWSAIGAKKSSFRPNFQSFSYDIDWLATVRGRAGLAIDATLVYLTGGIAFGRIKNSYGILNADEFVISIAQHQTKAGWTLGAGVEHLFAPHWSARAEVRYVDFGKSSTACVSGIGLPCLSGDRGEFRNSLTMGLVGVNYRFGGGNTANSSIVLAHQPPRAAAHWAGAYVGIQGGAARHDGSLDDAGFFSGGSLNTRFDDRRTGGTVGGLFGYNWQKGSFVYGLEGDWNWIGTKKTRLIQAFDADADNLSTSFDVNWLATLRGRAGLAFDSTLLYVTGGLAFAHVDNSVELTRTAHSNIGAFASFAQHQTKVGWTAGVGAEHLLSPNWIARAEFRYVDLGNTNAACTVVGATDFFGCLNLGYRGNFSNTLMLGLVGLAYKF